MVERDRLAQGSEPDPVLDTGSCDPCDRLARKWHRRKAAFDSLGKGREVSNTDSAPFAVRDTIGTCVTAGVTTVSHG